MTLDELLKKLTEVRDMYGKGTIYVVRGDKDRPNDKHGVPIVDVKFDRLTSTKVRLLS